MDQTSPQPPQPGGGAAAPARQQSQTAKAAISWLRDLTLSVVLAVLVILFVYQPVKVEGTSMMPTLVDQERIFINKFVYRFGLADIGRGDTVVFWFPQDTSKSYIKRVIGIPGDRIRIDAGQVFVNDRALVEDYVEEDYRDQISWPSSHLNKLVPASQYFVLGDHRSSSSDSRSWGFVPRENIYGKAVFAYWPLYKLGRLR